MKNIFKKELNFNLLKNDIIETLNLNITDSLSDCENYIFYGKQIDENGSFKLSSAEERFSSCSIKGNISSNEENDSSIVSISICKYFLQIAVFLLLEIFIALAFYYTRSKIIFPLLIVWPILLFIVLITSFNDRCSELKLILDEKVEENQRELEKQILKEKRRKNHFRDMPVEKFETEVIPLQDIVDLTTYDSKIKVKKFVKKKYLHNLYVALRDENYKFTYCKNLGRLKKYNKNGNLFLENCNYFVGSHVKNGTGIYQSGSHFIVYQFVNKSENILYNDTDEHTAVETFVTLLKNDICKRTGLPNVFDSAE